MIKIEDLGHNGFSGYCQIPIRFEVTARLLINEGLPAGITPVDPSWMKDYDVEEEEQPDRFPERFDVRNWTVLAAYLGDTRMGGAVLAFSTPGLNLLDGRTDLVHVMDIRVAPNARSQGIGTALWRTAEQWSRAQGATEIRVETQDINVPACHFYKSIGCTIVAINPEVYGIEIDEVQLIWGKAL